MKPWHKIINASAKSGPAEILIYDQIGKDWFSNDGIAAKDFAETLKGIAPDRELIVGINSPGGNVWDGLAIHNMLSARKAKVTTRNDGIAASIASIILMAGSDRQANTGSLVMIHRAWGMSMGNAEDMTKMAAELEKHDGILADIYSAKSGKSREEVLNMMAAETWFTGQEAKDAGFVNTLLTTAAALNAIPTEAAAHFKNAPAALKNSAAQAGGQPKQKQTDNTMNKKILVALLFEHGINNPTTAKAFTEADSDADFEAGLKALAAKPGLSADARLQAMQAQLDAVLARAGNDGANDLKKIQARLDRERTDRIERRLDQMVIDCKLTVDEVKDWKPKCLADESDELLAMLEKRTPVLPGSAPAGHIAGITIGAQGPRDHVMAMKTPRARFEFLRDNFADLRRSTYRRPGAPQAANTTDAALVTDMLTEGFTTFATNRLASLRICTKEVAADRQKPKAVLQHRFITAGGTAQSNATNFEDTTNFVGAEDNRPVTLAQITSGSHLTNAERQNGVTMAQWVEAKTAEFCDKIATLRNAVILEGTYTKTPTVASAAGFGGNELKTLWGQLKKYSIKNIALDGEYYAQFLPTDRFDFDVTEYRNRGWDNFVLDTNWSGATANTVGFACNPQALLCGVGLPIRSDRANSVSTESLIQMPNLGITVSITDWYSNTTRNDWTTYDIMIGFAALDADAGVLIKSA